jgi:hypothetical protein
MQTCSITTVPFPHTVQQIISNTSNGEKLHLLEQRLTGTRLSPSQDGIAQDKEHPGTNRSSQEDAMETDAEAYKENTPGETHLCSPLPLPCAQANSPLVALLNQAAPCAPEPSTNSKRRKTDRPQRRVSTSEDQLKASAAASKQYQQPSVGTSAASHLLGSAPTAAVAAAGPAAIATGQALAPQAELSHSAKPVKRSSSPSVVMEAGSNPPMSPYRAGECLAVLKHVACRGHMREINAPLGKCKGIQ